ncbi:MAG: sigma-54-dependent Fis family transcriptional regulator [Bacteroidia bacterium]|nr:sigma-54-dependent Fis family transcriptional regulator [Bacteroidia bacterium]
MTKVEKKEHILVVDDTPESIELIRRNLETKGYQIYSASSVFDAISVLENTHIDVVITDIKMPKISGLNLVRHVRENYKDTEVLVITGYPSIENAVESFKFGAEEYLIKSFTDQELFEAVQKVIDKLNLRRITQAKIYRAPKAPFGIIGESEVMNKVFNTIIKTSATFTTVIINGESGTGKELVARAIHYSSPQASAPFVPVNCGGIPEHLLESELFGYMKGAFTDALETRQGFFQAAEGGTIFLDEISNTSLAIQAKLLRVLQDKEVYMIGSRKSLKINVRIIVATNKDLVTLVNKGGFREDLYYRLNIISIDIPPLRERDKDIFLLINHFLSYYSKEFDKPILKFTDNALKILSNYHWPGNVRELENLIHKLVVMNDGSIIDAPDLPSIMRYSIEPEKCYNRTLKEVETEYIKNVLSNCGGNKSKAAKILGIDRKTLREKLHY